MTFFFYFSLSLLRPPCVHTPSCIPQSPGLLSAYREAFSPHGTVSSSTGQGELNNVIARHFCSLSASLGSALCSWPGKHCGLLALSELPRTRRLGPGRHHQALISTELTTPRLSNIISDPPPLPQYSRPNVLLPNLFHSRRMFTHRLTAPVEKIAQFSCPGEPEKPRSPGSGTKTICSTCLLALSEVFPHLVMLVLQFLKRSGLLFFRPFLSLLLWSRTVSVKACVL